MDDFQSEYIVEWGLFKISVWSEQSLIVLDLSIANTAFLTLDIPGDKADELSKVIGYAVRDGEEEREI